MGAKIRLFFQTAKKSPLFFYKMNTETRRYREILIRTLCLRASVFNNRYYSARAAKRRSRALSASPSASLSRVTNFEPMMAPAALA